MHFLETKKKNRVESGFELKESYFNEAIKNCKIAEVESNTKKLFDV